MTCSVKDCDRPDIARQLCRAHYGRWHRHGDPLAGRVPPSPKGERCAIEECAKPVFARGWCDSHYETWRRNGDPLKRVKVRPICTVDGCDEPNKSRGLCSKHLWRWRQHGDPLGSAPSRVKACIIDGCDATREGWGYCSKHYQRYVQTGDPLVKVHRSTSGAEREIAAFMESLGLEVSSSDREVISPLELDIYVPEHALAIEFNGLFWHSERWKARNYHREKWQRCREAGVRLIQVWEDEWEQRPDVVKAMLRSKVGLGPKPIGARSTRRIELASTESADFLSRHHIQGPSRGTHHIGLIYGDDLVAVAVFVKRTDAQAELARFAAARPVVGGLAKMMKGLPYSQFITFADHCISDGRLYESAGWQVDGEIPPDYRYAVGGERRHKFGYRLKRFKTDPGLTWVEGATERELAEINGLARVWDAGKTRYVLNAR